MTALLRHFEVQRNNLRETRFSESSTPLPLAPNQLLLRIEHFALTANNITYAAFGEAMNYWKFFPADNGWGRVPVWGFAIVEQSAQPDVLVGERIYGYFPMSTHLVVQVGRVTSASFVAACPHRITLPSVYNQYARCVADPSYDPNFEAEQMLLKPLFTTSFLIDDFLADNQFFGARRIILSSASSKTAYGTAFMLAHRKAGAAANRLIDTVVGLTSNENLEFVRNLGVYDEVFAYSQVSSMNVESSAFVDIAGNQALRGVIHHRLGDALQYSCAVGGTHWENLGSGLGAGAVNLPGPKPSLFFAPNQINKRLAEWGPAVLASRTAKAWNDFMQRVSNPTSPWLRVQKSLGDLAIQTEFRAALDGQVKADRGIILGFGQAH